MAVASDVITGFTDNNVFAEAKLNIACNRICTLIDQENGPVLTAFAFSGDASRIYQGLDPIGDVGAITFKTSHLTNIRIVLNQFVSKLGVTDLEAYKTRILFKMSGYRFEVIFSDTVVPGVDVNGVPCEDYSGGGGGLE